MLRRRGLLLLFAVELLASGMAWAQAPAATVDSNDARLRHASIEFLESQLGPRTGREGWALRLSGNRFDVGMSFGWREAAPDSGLVYLAVSGPALSMNHGRATPGFVQLYLLRDEPPGLRLLARSEPLLLGENGQPPEVSEVLRIGAGPRYAISLNLTQWWQGAALRTHWLFAQSGDLLVKVGSFEIYAAQCSDGSSACWTASLKIEPAAEPPDSACWPLRLTTTRSNRAGKELRRQSATVTCSAKGTYPTPKAFSGPFF